MRFQPCLDVGSEGSAAPRYFDIHTHAIAPSLPDLEAQYPWGHWPSVEQHSDTSAQIRVGGDPYRWIDDRCWSAQRRIADMDAEDVAVQVISPTPITFCHDAPAQGAIALAKMQNDFLAQMTSTFPDRLCALGAVPMQDPDAAVAELHFCMTELGFLGVEIGTKVGQRELSHPDFDPFFAAAAELGALVFIHPSDRTLDTRLAELGLSFAVGMPSETGLAAADLLISGALGRRPSVHLCLAHGAGTLPWLLPRLDRQVLMKDPTCTPDRLPSALARVLRCDSLTYDTASLELAVQRFGAHHVMVGTDYPFPAREAPAAAVVAEADGRFDAESRAAIGWSNADSMIREIRAKSKQKS
ncbi:amidohydrolase family protein [Nocardia arthritidis]|uniref:amidohydrolase family protein n=1 Tax=Nocardia arthritidis TaxID=228602 RepID=UPI0007A3ACB5|nr:amidohydrolase family protein [Nocardia arthritidis]